jgi:hypothetical protein
LTNPDLLLKAGALVAAQLACSEAMPRLEVLEAALV